MLINRGLENIDGRCADEFRFLVHKYPTVAFNPTNWITEANNQNILLHTEGYITVPELFDHDAVAKFDAYITPCSKLKDMWPDLNIHVTRGIGNWCDYFWLEEFKTFEEKIKGVCSFQTVYKTGREGDINHVKHEFMVNLHNHTNPDLILHTYGNRSPFGLPHMQQKPVMGNPGNYDVLKRMNDYMFCWACESTYHPLYSWGHVTERIFNCFKAKVIPIYIGCYNIEEYVPKELFIDFRDYDQNYPALGARLKELSEDKDQYNEMVEKAYQWNLANKVGDIKELEKTIAQCVETYPI